MSILRFLYTWLFDPPKTRAGWRFTRCCTAWNMLWTAAAAGFFFRWIFYPPPSNPVASWVSLIASIGYAMLSLTFLASLVYGHFNPPDYVTGKITVVVVPFYEDPTDPKGLIMGPPLTKSQIENLCNDEGEPQ